MDKNKPQFNIIANKKTTTHDDYHTGTITLNNLSSILIDGEQAKIDLGLIHGKSAAERGIKFVTQQEELLEGKDYWVVWVAVERNESGPCYAGVTACPMRVNHDTRRGWKNLADHVNRMDDALKRRIRIASLPRTEKKALKEFLIKHNQELWNNSSDELKEQL